MISETENKPSWLPVVVAAVAAVSVGGVQFFNRPLDSKRPSDPSTLLEAPRHRQFPLARLWQDPLHVVYEHWNNEPPMSVPFVTEVRDVTATAAGADGARPVLRLLVMLPGTPYSDDRERRRRQRYAVVSALTAAGFMPSEGTRLHYFQAPPFSDSVTFGSSNGTTLVGYETYEPEEVKPVPKVEPVPKHWASVDVFWLNTEDFLQHPLHKVSALVGVLDSNRPESDDATTIGETTTVLLGPPRSGVLKEMFEEDPKKTPSAVRGFLKAVAQIGDLDFEFLESSAQTARNALQVVSPQATIPIKWLVCPRDDEECPTQPPGVKSFHSAIAGDDWVLKAVLKELVDRKACTEARRRPRVVIVSEQDTLYGRLLGNLAQHVAKQVGNEKECEIQIVEHGYLQGVDGEMPPSDEDQARRNGPEQNADAAGGAQAVRSLLGGTFEQPFGASQLDYVRYLAERLLRDGSDAPPVAIGVLGTDLYDKLLLLQALRESHPGVVFFTTDMDARLLDPAVNRWTRNLIVGSAYGLSPPEPASDTFRDSYQVALFVAVQEKLGHRQRIAHEPKLFEISRTDFVTLGSQAPKRDREQAAALLIPLAWLAAFAAIMYWQQRGKTARMWRRRYVVVMILATTSAACLYAFVQHIPNREPEPLFEGVSAVPMVVLQITTIVFAVAMVGFANGRMRHALSRVADDLGELEPIYGMRALRSAVRELRFGNGNPGLSRALRRLIKAFVSAWKHDGAGGNNGSRDNRSKEAADLWRDVLHYRGLWPRFIRILTGLLVGLTLRKVYFETVRDNQPLLGQAVTAPGWVEWVLPVVLFWAIFYCCDTMGAWRRFIRAVYRFDIIGGKMDRNMKNVVARGHRNMDMLVNCTELVGPVVLLPLILMVLLMFGRSTLFEGWNWTMPLIVFHVGLGVYVLSIAIAFQRAASHARAAVLDRLREAKICAQVADSPTEIENVMEYIRSRHDGAFVPWTQHPILQTLALPLGSYALITLLEMWIGR